MCNIIKVSFMESINVTTTRTFIELLCKEIDNNPSASEVVLYMSTPGGDVELAIEIYNFLRNLDCRVITVNTSFVNSAGILIYLAGDERVCMPASSFYVHSVTKKLNGMFTFKELEREVQEIKGNTQKILTLLEGCSLKSSKYWIAVMARGVVLQADKAIKLGLAHVLRVTNKS